MAKRLIDWTVKGSILVMGKYVDAETPATVLEEFDMGKIFDEPEFSKLTEVQKYIITYGLKQKLADCGSSEKDPQAKAILAKEKFQDFVDGKLVGARANGTGAKENKRIAEKAREGAKVVSLEGLMMKKIAFPDTFTEEDQVKLDEFLHMQGDFAKKQGKK